MASRKRSLSIERDISEMYKELDEASCPICMDHPHNAVLLICSSHDKGCRSYICDTSYRHSNCLDRFRKLKAENADILSAPSLISTTQPDSVSTFNGIVDLESSGELTQDDPGHGLAVNGAEATLGTSGGSRRSSSNGINSVSEEQGETLFGGLDLGETNIEKSDPKADLRCPMCRGSVLGWKVVEEARKYLNLKSRSCSRESCSFSGNYMELRRHARRVHPTIRPADIDPSREQAWQRLENQREYNDIVSAVRAAMPGAVVLGDYVIENGDRFTGERERGSGEGGRLLSTYFLFQMIGSMEPGAEMRSGRSRALARHRRPGGTYRRRRFLWGENLLGLQDEDEEEVEDEDDEPELNMLSDIREEGSSSPRRRRRLTRAQSDEDQP